MPAEFYLTYKNVQLKINNCQSGTTVLAWHSEEPFDHSWSPHMKMFLQKRDNRAAAFCITAPIVSMFIRGQPWMGALVAVRAGKTRLGTRWALFAKVELF